MYVRLFQIGRTKKDAIAPAVNGVSRIAAFPVKCEFLNRWHSPNTAAFGVEVSVQTFPKIDAVAILKNGGQPI